LRKTNAYPDSFKSIGFTPEKQIETLTLSGMDTLVVKFTRVD
jgi:hypothetical protein